MVPPSTRAEKARCVSQHIASLPPVISKCTCIRCLWPLVIVFLPAMFNAFSSHPMKIKIPSRLSNLHIQIPSTHVFPRRSISISSRPCNNTAPIDEETLSDHDPSQYHQIKPGCTLLGDSSYTAMVKLGYGRTSTTWLCKDHRYVRT